MRTTGCAQTQAGVPGAVLGPRPGSASKALMLIECTAGLGAVHSVIESGFHCAEKFYFGSSAGASTYLLRSVAPVAPTYLLTYLPAYVLTRATLGGS